MPKGKGKFVNHKGKHRSFTNPDELEHQRQREEKERQWRAERGEISSSEEEEEEEKKKKGSDESSSEEETSSEEEEEEEGKAKGVEGLIQVENPNRVQQKAKKLSTLNTELAAATTAAAPSSSKPELSRREREELEKQRAAANYQRLHAKGKTEEARADLARLAIIKAQREEAAKKRADEAKMKEVEKQKKTQQTSKALGKKP